MNIEGYYICECGAVTVTTDVGEYSCKKENAERFFNGFDLFENEPLFTAYSCNHCVNKWGLDLCGCGSGELFGQCQNKSLYCAVPAQSLIDKYDCVLSRDALTARRCFY